MGSNKEVLDGVGLAVLATELCPNVRSPPHVVTRPMNLAEPTRSALIDKVNRKGITIG